MFNNNIVLNDGTNDTSYGLISIEGGRSVRSNAASPIGEPNVLTISHELKGSGAAQVARHLVRVDLTERSEAANGGISTATASAYMVLVAPSSLVSNATMVSVAKQVIDFLNATEDGAGSTNLDRLLANEP
jgi:hypothetical protein